MQNQLHNTTACRRSTSLLFAKNAMCVSRLWKNCIARWEQQSVEIAIGCIARNKSVLMCGVLVPIWYPWTQCNKKKHRAIEE